MAEIQRLEHFMARFELHPGEHLFSQGDESSSLYVIESGHIDLEVQTTAGRSRTIASLGPGESLGENSLLIGGRRTASAVARDSTCGWILYHAGFDMLRMDGAAGAVELMARLCESAVSRLRRRYETVAAELPPDGAGRRSRPDSSRHGLRLSSPRRSTCSACCASGSSSTTGRCRWSSVTRPRSSSSAALC